MRFIQPRRNFSAVPFRYTKHVPFAKEGQWRMVDNKILDATDLEYVRSIARNPSKKMKAKAVPPQRMNLKYLQTLDKVPPGVKMVHWREPPKLQRTYGYGHTFMTPRVFVSNVGPRTGSVGTQTSATNVHAIVAASLNGEAGYATDYSSDFDSYASARSDSSARSGSFLSTSGGEMQVNPHRILSGESRVIQVRPSPQRPRRGRSRFGQVPHLRTVLTNDQYQQLIVRNDGSGGVQNGHPGQHNPSGGPNTVRNASNIPTNSSPGGNFLSRGGPLTNPNPNPVTTNSRDFTGMSPAHTATFRPVTVQTDGWMRGEDGRVRRFYRSPQPPPRGRRARTSSAPGATPPRARRAIARSRGEEVFGISARNMSDGALSSYDDV